MAKNKEKNALAGYVRYDIEIVLKITHFYV